MPRRSKYEIECDGCGLKFDFRLITNHVKQVHDSITSPTGHVSHYSYIIGRDFCEECAGKNPDYRLWTG